MTTSQLASDFLAITQNLDSIPEGAHVTLYRSFSRDADGKLTGVEFCARVSVIDTDGFPVSETIEADTAAECLLMLARLLP